MTIRLSHLLAAIAAVATGAFAAPAMAQQKFMTIGTGGVTGVYYAAGGAICRLVNKDRAKHDIRCSVESTGGSVFNINTIKAGELDLGFAQSDVQFNAAKGVAMFKEAGAFGDLRAVFSVHPEPFTVLARKEANIKTLRRLQGQALQRRQPGLGHARLDGGTARADGLEALRLLARLGAQGRRARPGAVRRQDRRLLLRRRPPERQHPGSDDLVRRQARVADRSGGRQAGRRQAVLRQGDDPRRPVSEQPGCDARPMACSPRWWRRARSPPDTVYAVVKAVFDNFDEFKKLHPALANLKPESMVKDGLSAPLHEGAAKYYREKGWIK